MKTSKIKIKKVRVILFLAALVIFAWYPAASAKTLKVAMNIALTWPLGVDAKNAAEIDIARINKAGGLWIGGERYKIELIVDDNKMDLATAKIAAEKEIYRDGVKFILSDLWVDGFMELAEKNEVITIGGPNTPQIYEPTNKWSFRGAINITNFVALIPYAKEIFPDKKTFLGVFPDRLDGHAYAELHSQAAKNAGFKVLPPIFYPPTSIDMSAIGTKIKVLNPDILSPHGGGPQTDSLVFKAAYSAGYRGQGIGPATIPANVMMGIAGKEALEGFVSIGWPTEFYPATTAVGREYQADYVKKFGKWDYPEIVSGISWWILKSALQKAGTTDHRVVAKVLNNGVDYDSIGGRGIMIARPDLGVSRTVDTLIGDMPIKRVVNGKVTLYDTWSTEKVIELVKICYDIK